MNRTEDEEKRAVGGAHAIDGGIAQSALESAESYIARSPAAGRAVDGGWKAFSYAFQALLEWAEERGLIRQESDFPFFQRVPDGQGNEHECWFDEASNRWLKATFPNRFGLAWGRDGTATAGEYLKRLILQNKYFADDIQLVALVNCAERLRILISQPHVSGEPATCAEISEWFVHLGFQCLQSDDRVAWYREKENLLVADAHEGNVVKSTGGILLPIDLNLVQPIGELLDWIKSATIR